MKSKSFYIDDHQIRIATRLNFHQCWLGIIHHHEKGVTNFTISLFPFWFIQLSFKKITKGNGVFV